MIVKILKVATVAGFAFSALMAQAAPVTLVGDTVNYVYDDEQDALTLFGTPTIQGNVVRFIPPSFRAEATDTSGATITTANFIFDRVYSTDGKDLMEIKVVEFGDYEIINGGAVGGDVLLTATSNIDYFDFTSSSDAVDASGDSGGLQTWQMQTSVNPYADFTFDDATDMAVSIQNTLTATTDELGESAWIQKKLSFVATSEVPVPAAAWLFGSALLGLVGVARRKHS